MNRFAILCSLASAVFAVMVTLPGESRAVGSERGCREFASPVHDNPSPDFVRPSQQAQREGNEKATQAQEPAACRSVHLWYKAPAATAFYNELRIDESAPGTFFMACGFQVGYFGVQELSRGNKVVIFSVWDNADEGIAADERKVRVISNGEDVRVRRFGGEGTGGQSFYDYDWDNNETLRFVVFARPDGNRTKFSAHFYIASEHRWQHMATFSTIAKKSNLSGFYSFVEDFRRNGESVQQTRAARFGNTWVRSEDKNDPKWLSATSVTFTADQTQLENIDAGNSGDEFFLKTGGDVQNETTKLRESIELTDGLERMPPLDLPRVPFPSEAEIHKRPELRVLAYNIKHGRGNDGQVDLDRIAQVIRRLNPDVVALQEVDNGVERSRRTDQAVYLAKRLAMKSAFGPFFDYQGGEYGMAILSRHPILQTENVRLPDGAEPRTSLVAKIQMDESVFYLADVHFYRTETERADQAEKLLEHLGNVNEPIVVAGDFNSTPGSKVLQLFDDWKIPDKGEDHFTFSSDQPRTEIDFLMFRPVDAFDAKVIDVIDEPLASDHRPVILEIQFK